MRMRKKKWAEPYLEEHSDLVIQTPSEYKGKWKGEYETFHLEIGTGKGDYLCGMAQLYPEVSWVGIERDRSAAAVCAKKVVEAQLQNVKVIALDARDLSEWFEENEIDVIHLNFSDPWPQNGYRKRRLSHEGFVKQYSELLKPQGKVLMKTDNSGLFEFSLKEFTHHGFSLDEVSVDFRRNEHPEDIITEYEAKFMSLNQPIYRAEFKNEKI
ncbi:MAG: tRNA (guanosine(46)-N7)-methyltransferase TrmB [Erysipelotrichaceae bacterium]|nr:tRNA (guanosine(46)-N7)-methyltransferase TrmB [Erysipelotrichaceae bacterium]